MDRKRLPLLPGLLAILISGLVLAAFPLGADSQGEWSNPEVIASGVWGQVAVGPDATAHAVWAGPTAGIFQFNADVYYSNKAPGGTWTPLIKVSEIGRRSSGVQGMLIAVGGDGAVHVIWYDQEASGILYAQRTTDGQWLPPVPLLDEMSGGLTFDIVASEGGEVHVVLEDGRSDEDIYYSIKLPGQSWSTPVNISNTPDGSRAPHIALGGNGSVHVVWGDTSGSPESYYVTKLPNGSWTPAETIPGIPSQNADISSDSQGAAHVVRSDGNGVEILYSTKLPGGMWTPVANISNSPERSENASIASCLDGHLHAVWTERFVGAADQIYYVERASSGAWSSPANISNGILEADIASVAVGPDCSVHVIWTDDNPRQVRYAFRAPTVNTPVGTNVTVEPVDATTGMTIATLTFAEVSEAGTTSLASSSSGPAPPVGFSLGDLPIYYDISTTATYTPPVTVCISYDPTKYSDVTNLRLLHFEISAWADVTTSNDTINHVICGQVNTLSPFAVAELLNVAPTVDAGGPYAVNEGGSIIVTASGHDPEESPLTYAWDLDNNGSFETAGQSVTFSAAALTAPSNHTLVVRVTDIGGLTATDQATANVIYNFGGFLQPVDNLPTFNEVNAGAGVPVKFSLGGDRGLSIFETGYPKSQQIHCSSTAAVDAIEQTVAAGSSGLSYNASTATYTYVWKTNKAWAGTCRQLILNFDDGTSYLAYFKFK